MRKLAKIGIIILSFLTVLLAANKIWIGKVDNTTSLMNSIKQNLLKSQGDINGLSITGNVYTDDSNKKIDNTELVLYKMNSNNEYEKADVTYTDDNGQYKFQNLDIGTYKIDIPDNDEYKLLSEDNVFVLTSDTSTNNADLKAVETDFKAEINKYIKEVILNVNGNELVYTFDKKNKVNIPVKNLNNLSGQIIYEFEITNTKTKEGYVKVIKDILPDGLSFNKDKNSNWKEKDGVLYSTNLSNEVLKPNETKTLLLTLDISNTNEAKSYLNKVSITGELYHKVEFISFDEVLSQIEVLDGDTTIKESDLQKEGYIFTGWYKDSNLNEKFDFSIPITEDCKIYAGWVKVHTVNYIVDDNIYKTESVKNNDLTIKPTLDPTKEGYEFVDWYIDKECTKKFDFNTKIISDTNIYAKFEEKIKYYEVTYILDGEEFAKETVMQGSLIEDKKVPDKENKENEGKVNIYDFSGWYIDENYNELFNFDLGITNNIVLYGKYNETKVCVSRDNINIPTRESILEEIGLDNILNKYQQVNIDSTEIHGSYAITDDFVAILNSDNKYKIVQYTGTNNDEIIIPDTIDGIEVTEVDGAFNNLTIGELKISKSLISISNSFNSSIINEINFENAVNLTQISSAFQSVQTNQLNLGNAINLSNVEFIRAMTVTESIDFGNAISVTEVPAGFLSNKSIKSINFNNAIGINTIKQGAFSQVDIVDLSFGNTIGLTTIESGAFSGYKTQGGGILNIDFGNAINLSDIQADAFRSILNVDVLDMSKLFGLKHLTPYSIRHNILIKKVIFGSSIEIIEDQALYNNNIEELDFSCALNLKEINGEAFTYNNIKNAILENLPSFTTLEIGAFGYNPLEKYILRNLESLVNVNDLTNGARNGFFYENDSRYVPESESEFIIDNIAVTDLDFHIYAPYFSKVVIQNNKNLINLGNNGTGLFEDLYTIGIDQGRLKEIVIQNDEKLENIKRILYEVPIYTITLQNLPNLTSIGDYAFYMSTFFVDEIVLNDFPNLQTIGDYAFGFNGSGSNTHPNSYTGFNINSIILSNLPNLISIGESSFNVWGAETLVLDNLPSLTTIGEYAFAGHRAESIVLNSKNVPNLTTLGNESFWPYSDKDYGVAANLKNVEISDLQYLTSSNGQLFYFIGAIRGLENKINLDNLTLKNLPLVEKIFVSSGTGNGVTFHTGDSTIKNLRLENLPKLDLSTTSSNFVGLGIENITLIDLPSTTTIPEYNFSENNIKYLDLTKMGNLQVIDNQAFRSKTLEIIKLPESLTTIGFSAFDNGGGPGHPSDAIKCVEVQGDSSRFYGEDVISPVYTNLTYWEYIGFNFDIVPGTCTIPSNEETSSSNLAYNIAASILGLGLKSDSEATYSLVLYKLDNGTLIDNSSTYKLTKLIDNNYSDIKVLEDIENVGRYSISDTSSDYIKSFNNKIYLTNVGTGIYKLIDINDSNKVLTFVVENDGTLTGNVKINTKGNTDTVMSSSEAELITSIQTGFKKSSYIVLILLIITILALLLVLKRKRKYN